MNTPQYRRISSEDHDDYGVRSPRASSTGRTLSDRTSDKIVALVWVLLAMFVAYWCSFFSTLLFYEEVNRTVLNMAFLCWAAVVAGIIYLMAYLPLVIKLKDTEAWSVYCPKVIPGMIVSGIVGFILLIRGTWPVWGFLAPLIFAIEFMGFLFSLHFVPWTSGGGGEGITYV
ncbi:expressed unknown protein [Seminavis robusta]|uniref:Transmembrane protein n=1 Tax=Seminavis robusta TaxID=568900 RepID=A0A9N8ED96_9STRA|nr:expressed unknown protein [Seminavis robusta]|eukprot:Sro827_g207810.1 n/a (172) ;mRNA; f:18123-18733